MQKKLAQIVSSTLLLLLGVGILGVSLHGAHARVLRINDDWQVEETTQASLLLDVRMPGSLPYLAFRAQDRAENLTLDEENKPEVYLGRARQRIQASEYAFRHGQSEIAFSTLNKALVYVHNAVHACQSGAASESVCQNLQPLFESVANDLEHTGTEFLQHTDNGDLRARLDGLLDQLSSLRLAIQGATLRL